MSCDCGSAGVSVASPAAPPVVSASPIVYPHVLSKVPKFLVFGGKTGWIGQQLVTKLTSMGMEVHAAESRLEDRVATARELDAIRPSHVINAAGVTGRPNVDWCEDHKVETIRANVVGCLTLADLCLERNIHMTNMSTGCIYEYDTAHPIGFKGYTEQDSPNYSKSFYSETKIYLDKMIKNFPNVLQLRLRMPISDDLHPRNFVTKITHYKHVVDVPNSMTILSDLLPLAISMAQKRYTGIYNFTNPGAISHNEILELYKQYIDPTFTYVNFSLEDQAKILKAGRSNNTLDASKLLAHNPDYLLNEVHAAMVNCFKRMHANLAASGTLPVAHPENARRSA